MREEVKSRPDLVLLLSLLVVILLHPVLDQGNLRRLILGALILVPIIVSSVRLAQLKHWMWPSVLLGVSILVFTIANDLYPNPTLATIRFGLLATYFGLTAAGLFSYIRNARFITSSHLYTAISIYLLLALLWFALFGACTSLYPESIASSRGVDVNRQSELLYFSIVTLTTLGYGDIVALGGEVRMLAALEAMTGVLYVAITVAILVGSYRPGSSGSATEAESGVAPSHAKE